MAETSLILDELARKLMGDEHADVLRETLAWFVRELMEAEIAEQVGAVRHETSAQRVTHCALCACADSPAFSYQAWPLPRNRANTGHLPAGANAAAWAARN